MSVEGIQETIWFGADVWPATGGYTMLHSGRYTPGTGDVVARREGVSIVMGKRATAAWRSAGELWKPVSSTVIMVRLKWTRQRWQTSDETLVTVIFAYAPNC